MIRNAKTPWIVLAAMAVAALFAVGLARAQGTAGDAIAKPQPMAKNADPDWEVATVRPSDPNDGGHQHIRFHGQHVTLFDHTVEDFLLIGYGVQKVQLEGEPSWAKTERWNVDGVTDVAGEPDLRQLQELMRRRLCRQDPTHRSPARIPLTVA
jgi:hypothetical protein